MATEDKIDYSLYYCRFFGIVLVIFGHMTTYQRDFVRPLIYSFHMPLFFILSGITIVASIRKYNFKEFFIRRLENILIAGLFFELIMMLWTIFKNIFEKEYTSKQLLYKLLGIFIKWQGTEFDGGLWFFEVMFFAQIICYILVKCISNRKILLLLSIGVASLSYYFVDFFPNNSLPLRIEVIPLAVFYIIIGVAIENVHNSGRELVMKRNRKERTVASTIFIVGGVLLELILGCLHAKFGGDFAMDCHIFSNILIDSFYAIIGSLGVLMMSQGIELIGVIKSVVYIGKNSMVYYGLQGITVGILNTIIHCFFDTDGFVGIVFSCLSCMVSLMTITLFCRIYNKWIKEKWKRYFIKFRYQ